MSDTYNVKSILWANVHLLMLERYGKENLTRFAEDCHLGPGTASRIKEQQTSVGLEVIEKIAEAFSVQPWRLMAPSLQGGATSSRPLTTAELIVRVQADLEQIARKTAPRGSKVVKLAPSSKPSHPPRRKHG